MSKNSKTNSIPSTREHPKKTTRSHPRRNTAGTRAQKNSPRQKETDRRLPQISTLCLARDDEEEEELEEEKNISDKKGGFERKRNVTHHHHLLIILSPFNASVKSTIDPVYITDK